MIIYLCAVAFVLTVLGRLSFFIALLLEGYYLVSRGLNLGRIPLVGVYDTILFLSFSTALFSVPLYLVIKERTQAKQFLKIAALICAVFTFSATLSRPYSMPLPPVLRTFWFEFHVSLSFLSYGLFGVASVLGILALRTYEAETERYQYITILTGYLLFSLSMIFGGIWAFFAWGTYWLWTPKELWTTLLWLIYTLYLHLRFRPWWKGKRIAAVGVAGYVVVLFTYLGVGLLMKSSHSF